MKTSVLFVCMGNICRSPTVEGVFTKLVHDEGLAHAFEIDSAGTLDYHAGEAPDARSREHAAARGIDLSSLRARQVKAADFARFHHVLAMDRDNLRVLHERCPPEHRAKVRLFLEGHAPDEVPDPYYGGADGFEHVLDLAFEGSRRLLAELRATVGSL